MTDSTKPPLVGIIMGSKSDWETMKATAAVLDEFGVSHESRAISAHRSPDLVAEYAKSADSRGLEVIIAAAGMAAALPGVVAAMTPLPVLGVPMEGKLLGGLDAVLSMVQMPGGVPVGTLAIGSAGAKNAALLAVRILANSRPKLREQLREYHAKMADQIGKEAVL
jgi:5-(carboxyamino)imidazole ribonucleotide mutase